MGKAACCTGEGIRKGSWTAEEDQMLKAYIEAHGEGNWRSLPGKAGLQRCGKSCRLRWTNYLRPGIKRGSFTTEEDQTIIKLHAELGNRWAAIARQLQNRTDNEIKNYWNAHLKKRLTGMGIDPETHSPAAVATEEGEAIAEMEPEAQTLEQPKRPLTRKPALSASAQLLNRLATRLTSLPNLEAIKSHLPTWWDMPQRCDSDSSASEDNYNSLWLVGSLADAQEATFESDIESDGNASCKSSGAQSDETGKEGTQMKSEALNHVASRLGSLSCATEDLTREVVPDPDWGLGRHVAEFLKISVMSDIDVGGLFCDIASPFPDSRFLEDLSAASP